MKSWCTFIRNNPGTKLFCYRGGLRSKIALKWIHEYGEETSLVDGGYKKLRTLCLETVELKNGSDKKWIILGGYTGSGKTDFILPYKSTIDLEGIANHRGSAFGKKLSGQPSPCNFENMLAVTYLKNKSNWLLLEDESRLIGKNILNNNWYSKMQNSDLIILEVDLKDRVNNILNEYIMNPLENGVENEILTSMMTQALFNIQKRLGGERYLEIKAIMDEGFKDQNENRHRTWIEKILTGYYDPMYNYKMEKRKDSIIFRGAPSEVKSYLSDQGIL